MDQCGLNWTEQKFSGKNRLNGTEWTEQDQIAPKRTEGLVELQIFRP